MRVTKLEIDNLGLVGSLPNLLAQMPQLQVWSVSKNNFTGTIPASLATQLVALEKLDLSHNVLTGAVPDSFSSFDASTIKQIDLDHNNLETFPASLCDFFNNEVGKCKLSNNLWEDLPDCVPSKCNALPSKPFDFWGLGAALFAVICLAILALLALCGCICTHMARKRREAADPYSDAPQVLMPQHRLPQLSDPHFHRLEAGLAQEQRPFLAEEASAASVSAPKSAVCAPAPAVAEEEQRSEPSLFTSFSALELKEADGCVREKQAPSDFEGNWKDEPVVGGPPSRKSRYRAIVGTELRWADGSVSFLKMLTPTKFETVMQDEKYTAELLDGGQLLLWCDGDRWVRGSDDDVENSEPSTTPSLTSPTGSLGKAGVGAGSLGRNLKVPGSPPPPGHEWFSGLFGFAETSYADVKRWLRVTPATVGSGVVLESLVTGAKYNAGRFETPTLDSLRRRGAGVALPGRLQVYNDIGDVAAKHAVSDNRHATFQVASQFNCLEFVGPSVVPEDGVTGYKNDRTQGPACSIACGPATVYRNYFAPVSGPGTPSQEGQTRDCMLDCLADVSDLLGNVEGRLFEVRGGYTMADEAKLSELNVRLEELEAKAGLDVLRAALRVGVHEDVQVTSTNWGTRGVEDALQEVSQVFVSACAVARNRSSRAESWEKFASLVLEAAYEATMWTALLTADRHRGEQGSRKVFLTSLGGGVFGNSMDWVARAIRKSCERFKDYALDVYVITYSGEVHPLLQQLEKDFKKPAPSPGKDWFSDLFGFAETSYEEAKKWMRVVPGGYGEDVLESTISGAKYRVGSFDTPTLDTLRRRGAGVKLPGQLKLVNDTGKSQDIAEAHAAKENRFATFQVSSQFNCLDFIGPSVVPEDGVTGYQSAKTHDAQGRACAIACGPATVFRNYFVPVEAPRHEADGSLQEGQTRDRMLNNLADLSDVVGNMPTGRMFGVQGGFTMASDEQLAELNSKLEEFERKGKLDAVRESLRVGLQEDVQVTSTGWGSKRINDPSQVVNQIFVSACAVAFNWSSRPENWERIATLILEASYEATIWAAVLNAEKKRGEGGSRKVFLTLLGESMGNSMDWISGALHRTLDRFRNFDLEVHIVTLADKAHPELKQLEADVKVRPPAPGEDWFSCLLGFSETHYADTKKWLRVLPGDALGGGQMLESLVSGSRYSVGAFSTPSLWSLRRDLQGARLPGRLKLTCAAGDLAKLHGLAENRRATFQVVSQFNCLEFVGPSVVPEDGVTGYGDDRTQGTSSCIACGAATVFRNYFAQVPNSKGGQAQEGQTRDRMIDNLCDVSEVLGNTDGRMFHVQGGFTMASDDQLATLNAKLAEMARAGKLDQVRAALRVGVHADVQVTSAGSGNRRVQDPAQMVSQVFASPCAVAYNNSSKSQNWETFASLVLEAGYEATLCAAVANAQRHGGSDGSKKVFLVCLGDGMFGNSMQAIAAAMRKACERFQDFDLDIEVVVGPGEPHPLLLQLEGEFCRQEEVSLPKADPKHEDDITSGAVGFHSVSSADGLLESLQVTSSTTKA